jgi:hypothetical protein
LICYLLFCFVVDTKIQQLFDIAKHFPKKIKKKLKEERITIKVFPPHAGQKLILENKRRFNSIVCARRFGKTELISKVVNPLIMPALQGGVVGIFSPVLKDFSRTWETMKMTYTPLIEKIDNSKRIIWFAGGGELYLWSLADVGEQDNGRGWPFNRVIYEEVQKIPELVFEHNWTKAVRPALSDKKGDAFFIGTASGQDNVWHRLCKRGAKNGNCEYNSEGEGDLLEEEDTGVDNKDWITFRMVSTVNPIMTQEEVNDALRDMDDLSHKQEYYSHFIKFGQNMWLYVLKDKALQNKVLINTPKVNWSDDIYISFDFNKVPMTALVMQKSVNFTKDILDSKFKYAPIFKKEFKVGEKGKQATIYDTCEAIRLWVYQETGVKIGKWETGFYPCLLPLRITGDASGNTTSGMVKDPTHYYKIIKSELGLQDKVIKVPARNPYHSDSWLICNTIVSKCPGFAIDKTNCCELIKDFYRIKDDGKHGLEKGNTESNQADLLDCFRYMINTFCDDIWTK